MILCEFNQEGLLLLETLRELTNPRVSRGGVSLLERASALCLPSDVLRFSLCRLAHVCPREQGYRY